MELPEKIVNVQISDKAAAFIRSRRLTSPMVLVNIGFRLAGGDGCGCGGGCGEGQANKTEEFLSTILLDNGKPGGEFTKVDTEAGIPVYLSSRVYEAAQKSKSTLVVTAKGLIMKKLSIEGLDESALYNQSRSEKANCH